jgi:hypothetical protein
MRMWSQVDVSLTEPGTTDTTSVRHELDDAMLEQMHFCENPLHILILHIWGP